MARKIQVLLVDDLDGTDLGTEGQTVEFGWLGQRYEIDLSKQNAEKMKDVFGQYVQHARKPSRGGSSGTRTTAAGGRKGRNPEAAEARAWLIENGLMAESHRGRISSEHWEMYRNRGQMSLEGSSTGGSASAESQMSTDEAAGTSETPTRTRRGNSRSAAKAESEVETPESVAV